jgi:RecB family exonuclease
MFRLSPLRIRVLKICRLRYRYQYVDRMRARLRPEDTVGSLVHNVLFDLFSKLSPQERTSSRLVEMFEERWEALSPRFIRIRGVDSLQHAAVARLRRFAHERDLAAEPFLLEAYLAIPLADDIVLFGRADRIDEEPDSSLHVIDYKGAARPAEVDASQISLYAIMAEEKLGRTVSHASFWYLEDGRDWTVNLTEADKHTTRAEALAAAREMQTLIDYPPTIAAHCAGCPYLHACGHRDEIRRRRLQEGW